MNETPDTTDIVVFSEGTRLAANIFFPSSPAPEGGYPAILLCHGWGGMKSHLAMYAKRFARAGYVAMTFDYRGWGESDGKIISVEETPRLLEPGPATLPVRVLREIVDPVDQVADVKACLAYLLTQPGVDPLRVGLWGTSYGGGHVVFVTGNEPRIKATVAQIGGFGFPDAYRETAQARQSDKARGLIDPVVPQDGLDASPGLKGTPDIARMVGHSPLEAARKVRVPVLVIDAEFEELVDRKEHGFAAHTIIKKNAPSEYHTFPGTHYEVYDRFYEPSVELALGWYEKHL